MKHLVKISLLAVFLVSVVNVSLAMDYEAPDYRGQEGSTVQGWEFNTDDRAPLPDLDENPYGTPQATVLGGSWGATPDGRGGAWYDASIQFYVPNTGNDAPDTYKELRIQVTLVSLSGISPDGFPYIDVLGTDGVSLGQVVGQQLIDMGSGMAVYIEDWHIEPNPIEEWIVINPVQAFSVTPSSGIDEVVIDTICIPEPTTMVLLALGSVLLRKRR